MSIAKLAPRGVPRFCGYQCFVGELVHLIPSFIRTSRQEESSVALVANTTPWNPDGAALKSLLPRWLPIGRKSFAQMASSNDGRFTFIPVDWRCKPAQEAIRVHIMRQRHRQARRDPKTPRVMRHERSSGEEIHFWNSSDEYSGRSKDCESRADRLSASRECPRLPHSDIGQSPGDEYRSLLLSPSASSPELSETSDSVIYPPLSSPLDVEEILVRHCEAYFFGVASSELTILHRSPICRRISDHSSASAGLSRHCGNFQRLPGDHSRKLCRRKRCKTTSEHS